jgi:hypothetical protein
MSCDYNMWWWWWWWGAVNRGVEFPYTFRLRNADTETSAGTAYPIAHCGVLDFEAPAGLCYLPTSVRNIWCFFGRTCTR